MRAFPKPSEIRRKRHDVIDGIRYWKDKTTNEDREECVTSEARTRRRREIYDRAGGRCERCGRRVDFNAEPLAPNSMHWAHKKAKRMGGGFTDDSLKNAECLCRDCHLAGDHKQYKV
jgi:hypothetical protein